MASFNGKPAREPRARAPPVDSEDSCLSDSGDSDEEPTPKPGDNKILSRFLSLLVILMSIAVQTRWVDKILLCSEVIFFFSALRR